VVHVAAIGAPFRVEKEKDLLLFELAARQAGVVAMPLDAFRCGDGMAKNRGTLERVEYSVQWEDIQTIST
jgi:hypothetical protein